MYKIELKNGKTFFCDDKSTIFEAAKSNGIILEHSCLTARCRSCAVKVLSGKITEKLEDLVLSTNEKLNNWTLSCNAIPNTDLVLDLEDLGDVKFFEKKIVPAKIQGLKKINDSVIEVIVRTPPNSNFVYNSGQFVNIIKGSLKRSYSIANAYQENSCLTFLIKKYENGLMSDYWFNESKPNDLIRIEGPMGTFFLRETKVENIIFLATGTGVAPIKAILEDINYNYQNYQNKNFWVFNGARHEIDLFWKPSDLNAIPNLKYIPVLSKLTEKWNGEIGYVQEVVLRAGIDLKSAQVYACGSDSMIQSAKKSLVNNGLDVENFFSDAFVETN